MRKIKLSRNNANELKGFLQQAGKRIFDTGKKLYYVDFNGQGCKVSYA